MGAWIKNVMFAREESGRNWDNAGRSGKGRMRHTNVPAHRDDSFGSQKTTTRMG